ncbi:MAG: HU family DNA-binding protein [Candidatus Neomarinimicrobiota bacterium]
MNNSELVKTLAQRSGLTQKETKQLLKQSVKVFSDQLGDYLGFSIPDLGTFATHIREERQAYDLNRRSHVILPPKRLVSFSPAVGLKEEIKDVEVAARSKPDPAHSAKEAPVAEGVPEIEDGETESSHDVLRREHLAEAEAAEEAAEVEPIESAAADEPSKQSEPAPAEPLDVPEVTDPELKDASESSVEDSPDSPDDLPPSEPGNADPHPEDQP